MPPQGGNPAAGGGQQSGGWGWTGVGQGLNNFAQSFMSDPISTIGDYVRYGVSPAERNLIEFSGSIPGTDPNMSSSSPNEPMQSRQTSAFLFGQQWPSAAPVLQQGVNWLHDPNSSLNQFSNANPGETGNYLTLGMVNPFADTNPNLVNAATQYANLGAQNAGLPPGQAMPNFADVQGGASASQTPLDALNNGSAPQPQPIPQFSTSIDVNGQAPDNTTSEGQVAENPTITDSNLPTAGGVNPQLPSANQTQTASNYPPPPTQPQPPSQFSSANANAGTSDAQITAEENNSNFYINLVNGQAIANAQRAAFNNQLASVMAQTDPSALNQYGLSPYGGSWLGR